MLGLGVDMLRIVAFLMLGACTSEPPANPQPAAVSWTTWQDYGLGLTLDHPDSWSAESFGDARALVLRNEGYPVLVVSYLTAAEAEDDGLWARYDQVGTGTLAGEPAALYAYDYVEPPSSLPTRSWVIPWREKSLSVAFRVRDGQLDAVQEAMLTRVRLADPKPVP